MKLALTIIILLSVQLIYGQNNNLEVKYGVYGSYADFSCFQELTLFENGSFLFYDRIELGNSFKYKGNWEIVGNEIILFNFKNNKKKPIPIKYNIEADQLCALTVSKICFKWREIK